MAVLTGMVAGAMVFSSFAVPTHKESTDCSEVTIKDGWREVGVFIGTCKDCYYSQKFRIWETRDACSSYYWVCNYSNIDDEEFLKNPDETRCYHGALRQRDGKWEAVIEGKVYTIRDF